MYFIAAVALAAFVILRLFTTVRRLAETFVAKHTGVWLMLMGVVHGLSNLGGSLLVILAASRHRNKEDIRRLVAFVYAAFATIQLVILFLLNSNVFGLYQLLSAFVAICIFLLAGDRTFRWVPAPKFERAFTGFMAFYAAALSLKAFGVV